jgi:hypothetical protein
MATLTQNAVELPSSLLADIKRYANEEGRSVDELVEEAVRLYMEVEPRHNAVLRRARKETREAADSVGLTPDEYVMKIVKDERAKLHQSE